MTGKKRLLVSLICMLVLFGWAVRVQAEALPGELTQTLDLSELNHFLQTLDDDVLKYLPRLEPESWGVNGPQWNLPVIGRGIAKYFLREIVFNLKLLGELLLLAMALAVLQNLQHAFETDTVNRIAFGLCFLVVMGIVLNSFRVTFAIANGALTEMTNFMYAIVPLLFTLIAAGGGVTTTLMVHPLLVSSVGMIAALVKNLVFPLMLFGGVLGLANYVTDGFQVNKLATLLKKAALGLMGFAMAVFIGIITIKGFAASVADSTTLRTAKYFSHNFLPVVGGAISDTMELAAGCSLVLKSGLGVFGFGLVVLITVFPLLKILAVALVYHLAGAIVQPLGNNRLADAMQLVGETFLNLFGAVAISGLMFFIGIAILVSIANFGFR